MSPGRFEHFFSESRLGRWSTKAHASTSQREDTAELDEKWDWDQNIDRGPAEIKQERMKRAEHDLIGLGGQFGPMVKAQ